MSPDRDGSRLTPARLTTWVVSRTSVVQMLINEIINKILINEIINKILINEISINEISTDPYCRSPCALTGMAPGSRRLDSRLGS